MEKRVGSGVGVILFKNGKILMGLRHPDPEKADSAFGSAGEWCLPGGKMDWDDESFESAAVREVEEETSIRILNPKVISLHNCKNEKAHYVTIGLLATEWEGECQTMEPDEITKWEWFEITNLPQPIYFPSNMVINNYKLGEFYIKSDSK